MSDTLKLDETYRVVDRRRVAEALRALKLSRPFTSADAIRVGKALGTNVVLTGTVTKFEAAQNCV